MILSLAATLFVLVPFLSWLSSNKLTPNNELYHENPNEPVLQFELRHLHAVSPTSGHILFSDVSSQALNTLSGMSDPSGSTKSSYIIQSRLSKPIGPRLRSIEFGENERLDWNEDEILSPNVESLETLRELAKMTNNAYVEPDDPAWYDLHGNWNVSLPFGWEPDADGFRGHVFATPDNSTVVVSIKGTSAAFFGGGGPTAKKDKLNDNLLFSCCCARVDWTWTTVCDCYRGGWKCDQTCLQTAIITESLFYPIGTLICFHSPHANIWMIGHSLGGALSSLVGITFGVPVVTFEAPGDRLAASRLHLPSPPSTHHVTHVYHTADPIPMGHAMVCHLGKSIVFDTVSNASWTVDIRTHGIVNVIERLLAEPWPPSVDMGREVPEAKAEEDCVECFSWDFGDFPA
ncbi:Alpha/Beta hydrolase protein [Gymnopilus junonius]|uniref:triacylglycerol lipase n=1 Tax=Gymnopilus junonius TaxID=109634 RepID=A0A9P5TQK9_GYMJU|nr:Alpha/Beta hydrolase protein [Gymnopilus junonius]